MSIDVLIPILDHTPPVLDYFTPIIDYFSPHSLFRLLFNFFLLLQKYLCPCKYYQI